VDVDAVPAALAARLGPEATGGLLHVLDLAHSDWSDDVMSVVGERFERRLSEEGSGLRVQIAHTEAALRKEISQLEMNVRRELSRVEAGLRQDFSQMEVRVLREVGNSRFELLKWSFLFWIGQVVTMSAIIAAMLRIIH
jgi:hypothetical protein